MNKTGETYLKLSQYDDAKSAFENMTRSCPEDYRGWWGLIKTETRDFSRIPEDFRNINTWFSFIEKLSDPNTFEKLQAQYSAYLKKIAEDKTKVSWRKISSDIKSVEESIASLENNLTKQKEKVESKKSRLQTLKRQQTMSAARKMNQEERASI